MDKVLLVDCCLRGEQSRTAKLLEAFAEALPSSVEAETLVLEEENLACLTGICINALYPASGIGVNIDS